MKHRKEGAEMWTRGHIYALIICTTLLLITIISSFSYGGH